MVIDYHLDIAHEHSDKVFGLLIDEIVEKSQNILIKHSNLKYFYMAMGVWGFTVKRQFSTNGKTFSEGDKVDDMDLSYIKPIGDIIDTYDEEFKLTGYPVRVTKDGREKW